MHSGGDAHLGTVASAMGDAMKSTGGAVASVHLRRGWCQSCSDFVGHGFGFESKQGPKVVNKISILNFGQPSLGQGSKREPCHCLGPN